MVTSEAHPVSGARATPLGAMRYIAVTSPALAASLGSVGFETSLQSAPVIFYDRKDTLQDRFLASFGIGPEVFTGLVHYAPSPTAMIDLAARGLGWCMAPESLAQPWIDRGQVVALAPEHAIAALLAVLGHPFGASHAAWRRHTENGRNETAAVGGVKRNRRGSLQSSGASSSRVSM